MKKLFTLALALASFLAINAQDPANWTVGQNVAADLGLGDVDGTSFSGQVSKNSDDNRPHDKVVETLGNFWKVEGDLPNEFLESYDGNIGIYGFYDKKEADMYQVVKFPAGAYTVDVQALYREGTPADNFTNHFNKKFMKYGHLYADCLTSEDPKSAVTRNFDKVLCSLATAGQHESVYYFGDGSWMNDFDYESKEVDEEGKPIHYYCPQCLVGLSQYFALGKYHNTMKIVVTEPTYIRIGFRKTGYITADWLVFTNLQVIYDGPADEAAKIELAKEEYYASLSNLEDVQNDVIATGFDALAGLISDDIIDAEDAVSAAESEAAIVAVKNSVESKIDFYSNSLQFVKNLADLLSSCKDILASTEFEGYTQFERLFRSYSTKALTDDSSALGDNPADYYNDIYQGLSKCRADYLNTQPADEKGAKDFTSLVKNPWFVNPEYTPNHNDDGTWTLSESTWGWGSVGNPNSYANAKNGRTDISSNVVLSPSDDVTNQWYKANRYTGWSSGIALYYQGGLIGVSDGWNSLATGTIGIEQQLVGLPNGYYSLKGLVRGNNGDVAWDGKSREIFAQNSNGEVVVSETVKNDGDRGWGNNWYEWNPAAWADVETSIISALDGRLLIGGRCSKVANFTGFRLYFYGESLDFDGKLQESLDRINLEELQFAGDKNAVNALLAQIANMRPIQGKDDYDTAFSLFNQAKNLYELAVAGEKNYNALNTIAAYADYPFVDPALNYMLNYGEGANDTYDKVAELNEIARVYGVYCGVYDKAVALNDATVNAILENQVAALKAEMKDADQMGAYLDELSVPYNIALMAAAGASEASEANPTNVSTFIVNPDFTDAPTTGWSGASPTNNEYSYDTNGKRANAELWNASAFTLSQTITGLPAGTYEIRVKAIYRDCGSVDQAHVDAYNEAGNEDAWANHNAQLFAKTSDANDKFSYIKAIESLQYPENSFTEIVTAWGTEYDAEDNLVAYPEKAQAIAGTEKSYDGDLYDDDAAEGAYPFDTKVGNFYYPASMQGFLQICKKHPADVTNKVQITIEQGDALEIGIRKTAAINADWVIFDDFELYYISGDTFKQIVTGIEDVNAITTNGVKYNVAGQRVSNSYKGIVIMDGKKQYIK